VPAILEIPCADRCAHAALARPGWWTARDSDWEAPWHQVATAAVAYGPDALTLITPAAIDGATLAAPCGLHTQRYQQLASLAIVACHTAGQPVPKGFLAALADGAPTQVVPRPQHVRGAVAGVLASRGVKDAEAVAIELLPEGGLA
jgi:hypothetical protein